MIDRFIKAWALFVVENRLMVITMSLLSFVVFAFPVYKTIQYQKQQNILNEKGKTDAQGFDDFEEASEADKKRLANRWLYFDNSNEMWFLEDDSALLNFEELKTKFGDMEYLLIGIDARPQDNNVFHRDTLKVIHKLTEFLENHEYVTKTNSLTNYQYVESENDTLTTKYLIEDINALEGTTQEMDKLVGIMEKETLVHDFLITSDFKHTIVTARTLHLKNTIDHMVKLVRDLRSFIQKENVEEQGYHLYLNGNPIISERLQVSSGADIATTFPLMILLIVVFLMFTFRSIAGVFMPFVVIIGSVLSVIGALGYLGFAFNRVNITIPTLLIAVGIGDSVHIITDFFQFRSKGNDAKSAARLAVESLWLPCFYTSLTTIIGFLAISISDLVLLKEYGYVAAIGVFIAFLISVTTLPALLTLSKSKSKTPHRIATSGFTARIANGLTPFTFKYSKPISVLGVILAIGAVISTSQLKVEANFLSYFKKDTPIYKSIKYFDRVYNGGYHLEFIVDSGLKGGALEPAFLERTLALQNYLEGLAYSGKANSFVNYIRKMNQSMYNNDPDYYKIPPTREHVAQYLILYENSSPDEDLSDLKTLDNRFLRISLRIKNMSSAVMQDHLTEIEEAAKRDFSDLSFKTTGNIVLFNNMHYYIHEGLIKSFSLAITLIVVCLFVLLRSFKYGLLSLIPSIFPAVFTGGVMAIAGVSLDFSSMIIAAITFGIAVDDTIHVVTSYANARNSGKTQRDAMQSAMEASGRAVIYTSLILFFGFFVMTMSSFVPNIYFGIFGSLIILMALLSDLFLLPAITFLKAEKTGVEQFQ